MGATISVGVATIPDSADDLESLVDAADRALLRAKRAGKNQIRTAPRRAPAARRRRPAQARSAVPAWIGGPGETAVKGRKLVAWLQGPGVDPAITWEPQRLSLTLRGRVRPRTMGILDDAIREHLDLKRKHGARDADLREIEDRRSVRPIAPIPLRPASSSAGFLPPAPRRPSPNRTWAVARSRPGWSSPRRCCRPSPAPRSPRPGRRGSRSALPRASTRSPVRWSCPARTRFRARSASMTRSRATSRPPSRARELPPARAEPPRPETPDAVGVARGPDRGGGAVPRGQRGAARRAPRISPPPEVAEPPRPPSRRPPTRPIRSRECGEEPRPLTPEPESTVPDPPPPPPEHRSGAAGQGPGRVDIPTQEHPPPGETGDLPPLSLPERSTSRITSSRPVRPLRRGGALRRSGAACGLRVDRPSMTSRPTRTRLVESPASEPDDDFEALGPAEEEAPYLDEEEPYAEEPPSGTEPPAGAEPPAEEPRTEVRPALEDEEAYEGGAPDPEEAWKRRRPRRVSGSRRARRRTSTSTTRPGTT